MAKQTRTTTAESRARLAVDRCGSVSEALLYTQRMYERLKGVGGPDGLIGLTETIAVLTEWEQEAAVRATEQAVERGHLWVARMGR